MGQILSQPVTEKHSEEGKDGRLFYGVSSMQGWRMSMEDSHAAVLDLKRLGDDASAPQFTDKVSFFAVYDGHGGDKVALFSGENLHNIVARQPCFNQGNFSQALKDGFLSTDRAILQDDAYKNEQSGCTATTAIITDKRIYCANAGDSRTVLGLKGHAKPLSYDHKPNHEGERARICAAGGYVEAQRVNGNLALSRAIGDFDFKKSANLPPEEQIVTAYPDVMEHAISPDDEFLVLACDGIWDCMHNQTVVEFIRRGIASKQSLTFICENLMNNCLAPKSDMSGIGCDNMTVMIVALLQNGQTEEEWYEMIAERVRNGDGPVAPESFAQPKENEFDSAESDPSPPAHGQSISLRELLGDSFQLVPGQGGNVFLQGDQAASLLSSLGVGGHGGASISFDDGDEHDHHVLLEEDDHDRIEEVDEEESADGPINTPSAVPPVTTEDETN